MKNLFFLATVLLFVSCSKEDDANEFKQGEECFLEEGVWNVVISYEKGLNSTIIPDEIGSLDVATSHFESALEADKVEVGIIQFTLDNRWMFSTWISEDCTKFSIALGEIEGTPDYYYTIIEKEGDFFLQQDTEGRYRIIYKIE